MSERSGLEIAILGMAGRFPQARNVEQLWRNLRDGVEAISFFSAEELAADGIPPELLADPNYVRAAGVLDDIDQFDAAFFDLAPREAELLDPQQRLLLECASEALEKAGYAGTRRTVGVFAGASQSSYLAHNIASNPEILASSGGLAVALASDLGFVATRLSYKLNLSGPSLTVQTACSTSLVAIHLACQSLLSGECEIALAGAASVWVPQKAGHLYQKGGINSPDGHCRAFDAQAEGTVAGQGAGVVVLKLLEDALADGDPIRAVIKGSAINNDGSLKAGFTAPSRDGQARVLRAAYQRAEVDPGSLGLLEAHGTATPLGDPIEVAALTQVFRLTTDRRRFCALGSVKTNLGHLDAAAGMAGLFKAVLALENRQIPPSLHYERPNPQIDFESSPFFVPTQPAEWNTGDGPRRAGVSAFGIGGTNAHVVLEEAPEAETSGPSRPWQVLSLSARSAPALERLTDDFAAHLAGTEQSLADVAFTLQVGRRELDHRRVVVASSAAAAAEALGTRDPRRVWTTSQEAGERPVAFLLSGLGDHYAGMARGLYRTEDVFRREVDRCADLLQPELGLDLRAVLFSQASRSEGDGAGLDLRALLGRGPRRDESEDPLRRTLIAQPAVFVVGWALAQLWISWGIRPQALFGYSLGEYTAACLAGVMALEDALPLVAHRARLIEELPPGAMLAVPLAEEEVLRRLPASLSLAAVNGPGVSVVSGPPEAVAELEAQLSGEGLACRRVPTTHAFHSWMMEPVRERLAARIARIPLAAPRIPYLSNVTGTWVTAAEATDPASWARHLCAPVRFGKAVEALWSGSSRVLLEVGPGQGLSTLALQHPASRGREALPSLPHAQDRQPDERFALDTLAKLWLSGVAVDWERLYEGQDRHRVELPTSPFERKRFWIDPPRQAATARPQAITSASEPVSQPSVPPAGALHGRPKLRNPYVAPSSVIEERLAGLWQSLLGVEPVGVHDNFFELGGHSLLGTQLMARLRLDFGAELPLSSLFEHPVIADLAAEVAAHAGPVRPPLRARIDGRDPAPLSYAQQRLWFLDQLQPGNPFYNIASAFRLRGPLDPDLLSAAFNEVVRRHETLRTTFAAPEGVPVQVISPQLSLEIQREELSDILALAGRMREQARQPFDLAFGPLLRVSLTRMGEEEHALLLIIHHIIADGWSIQVMLAELAAVYSALAAGKPSPLPDPAIQYADYVLWQREWLEAGALAEQLAHWTSRLAGAPGSLDLPMDRPRPAEQTFQGATRRMELPAELAGALARLAVEEGASQFMALLGGFEILLHRHGAQDDMVIGTPVANRTQRETEGMIGLFVNTLALRTDLSGDPSARELLSRVRQVTLEAYDYQDLPFDRLVEELRPERTLSHTPIFQVLFQLLNQPVPPAAAWGMEVEMLDAEPGIAAFDLTFSLVESSAGLVGALEYDTALFDDSTVEALLARYRTLLAGLAAHPDRRISELPLLSDAETEQVLRHLNQTAMPFPETLVHRLFEAQVERIPGTVAAVCAGEILTYSALNARSNRLAHRLRDQGVGPEVLVGISLPRSLDLLVAVLGVLKAGGAYVPLDPAYPAERLDMMLSDSGIEVLLRDSLPTEDVLGDPGNLEGGAGPENRAYVLYTSGSTGRPKGVEIEHRALTNFLWSMRREPGLRAEDVLLAVTSLSFDIAGLELYLPLLVGARLEIVSGEETGDGPRLLERLRASGATAVQATPSTWRMLLDAGWTEHDRLRLAMAGGEALPGELADRLRRRADELWNVYGPTETTVWSTAFRVESESAATVSIGRPIANTRLYVLDRRLSPAPPGTPGELYIGGTGVARGYLSRPDLTAERFVPDPWSLQGGERLYRTGDLVRHPSGGDLEFLGRIDHQVKIRGHRIETGEIEAVLSTHPAVRETVVMARDDGGGLRLAAYLVLDPAFPGDLPAELRELVRQSLPDYMVPSSFVVLEALPLTPNRKVDRKALPALQATPAGLFIAPRTPVEESLAAIWTEVLAVPRVGLADDFFALGGHSLLATQVVSWVRTALGVEIPVRGLFEAPTLAAFAQRVESARHSGALAVPPLRPRPRGEESPLSFAQQRLWFLDQLTPGDPSYNIVSDFRMIGPLDRRAFSASLDEVVRRHESLRTTFRATGGRPIQRVEPARALPLPIVDLQGLPPGLRAEESWKLASEEARRPFDLASGSLLRVSLLVLAPTEHLALATLHHIVSDGWSSTVLQNEVKALYEAFAAGRPSPLPELPLQYPDYAIWQRESLQGEALAGELAYWKERLASPPTLDLPTDRPRPAYGSLRGAEARSELSPELTARLRRLAQSRGATLYMALLALFETLLHRSTGQSDLLVGTPIANRHRAEVEGLIGCFVNMLALRADLSGNPGFLGLVDRVRQVTLEAYSHQETPFEKVVGELHPERDTGANPLLQAVFVFQNFPAPGAPIPGLRIEPVEVGQGTAKFDLSLFLVERGSSLETMIEYSTDLFDRATVRRLLEHLEILAEGAVADPCRSLAELPLLGEAERHQLLVDWVAMTPQSSVACLHRRFEIQASHMPGAPAVVHQNERLAYGELNRRANRLARRLQELGVRPETRVALCLERTPEMVVAILAVLKAGGAYVPLDPALPLDRLAFLLEDSRVSVLLTERRLAPNLPESRAEKLWLDEIDLGSGPDDDLAVPVHPDNLAYVIYTSGSTGRPKGVLVSHANVDRLFTSTEPWFQPRASDVWTLFHSYAFDFSVWEIWGALLYGGRLVIVPYWTSRSPDAFHELLCREEVTVLSQTPSAFRHLVRADGESRGEVALRLVVFGGEALDVQSLSPWFSRHPEDRPRLVNMYGITETTVHVTYRPISPRDLEASGSSPIGIAIPDLAAYLLDAQGQPVPVGVPGEIHVAGAGLARGYLNRPALTAERFVPHPFSRTPGERLYRSGDLARYRPDGELEYLGRIDHQVKIRGFRIELGEIQAVLSSHPEVREAAVILHQAQDSSPRLVAYVVPAAENEGAPSLRAGLRQYLLEKLPDYMVPADFVALQALPLTGNGKLDRRALPAPEAGRTDQAAAEFLAPRTSLEQTLAAIWGAALGIDRVGRDDNFFDLGGHSLLMIEVHARLREALRREIAVVELFQHPTIGALAEHLAGDSRKLLRTPGPAAQPSADLAVVGMAGRFPGALDVEQFWGNLRNGIESIRPLTDEDLLAAGRSHTDFEKPEFVRAEPVLAGFDLFDNEFFGMTPREAEVLDPQQRLFLECAWQCLEAAGYNPARCPGRVGVYAGARWNSYVINLFTNPGMMETLDGLTVLTAIDKDYLATRVSYELNLRGPSLTVQTACSTSLVAVHLAREALLSGQCDMALAGGVSVRVPHGVGYFHEAGGVSSPDGHCRAFDAQGGGTVFGSGVGTVLLKRLEDAVRDGDHIHAILKGSAINNDGALKVGYTAPSVEGQREVIAAAHEVAGVSPETITYVEGHGTATPLGDPIEVAALTQAFREGTDRTGFCALGSVKTNVGHLDAAAGIAGFIKTVLALENRQIPPSLHFAEPNPKIDFTASPFYVNTELADWPIDGMPRRAGVSSFGIGGTNAHVVLEEAPAKEPSSPSRSGQVLLLSARTPAALAKARADLAGFLDRHPAVSLPDVAYTLQEGRQTFEHRLATVCRTVGEAIAALKGETSEGIFARRQDPIRRPVAFLFPGQGAQHIDMGRDLYKTEPVFRREMDACAALLRPHLGCDLCNLLYPIAEKRVEAERELKQTRCAQPALFAVEYALAKLWMSWGLVPGAMAGHSLGEYVAACLAGVFSLEDALALVAARGELMEGLPAGAMLSVDLSEAALTNRLEGTGLSLAAVNAPGLCVASGSAEQIGMLRASLEAEGVSCRLLHTSHAFHSAMMEPILDRFAQILARMPLQPPAVPYLSNLTGRWITSREATDPGYWTRHLRGTVHFGENLALLLAQPEMALLEIGPGRALASVVRRQRDLGEGRVVVSSMRHPTAPGSDETAMLEAVGRLWLGGVEIDWRSFHQGGRRHRLTLPTYPFERRRFWIEPGRAVLQALRGGAMTEELRHEASAAPASLSAYDRPALATTFEEPRDPVEHRLAEIWGTLLGIEQVGAHDDFFELGGHSLLATRLASHVRSTFAVELPLDAIFAAPTVAKLAIQVRERLEGQDSRSTERIERVPREGDLPLSFAQQRLFFLDVMSPEDASYNLPLGLRLSGNLDLSALRRSLEILVARHEVLRTTFTLEAGRASQVVAPEVPAENRSLPVIDLEALPPEVREGETRRLAIEEAGRGFDLFRGPVLRAHLLRLDAREHILLLTIHHIAADGWSWSVVFREVVACYEALTEGRPPQLPELPIQYADFSVWQRSRLQGEVLERQLSYWQEKLARLPLTELPADRPRPAVRTGRGAELPLALPVELTASLRKLGRETDATLFMVLLSGFFVLLHSYSEEDDLVVGTDVANRTQSETEGLVGLFVNQLVLRSNLGGSPTFRELVSRVRESAFEAYAHQDVPFDKLVEALNPGRDMSRTPLFQWKFVLQNTPVEARELPELFISGLGFHNQTAKFDLLINLLESDSGLVGNAEYSTDLYEARTIERLLADFVTVLQAAVADPEAPLSAIEAELAAASRQVRERRARERQEIRGRTLERVRRKVITVQTVEVEP